WSSDACSSDLLPQGIVDVADGLRQPTAGLATLQRGSLLTGRATLRRGSLLLAAGRLAGLQPGILRWATLERGEPSGAVLLAGLAVHQPGLSAPLTGGLAGPRRGPSIPLALRLGGLRRGIVAVVMWAGLVPGAPSGATLERGEPSMGQANASATSASLRDQPLGQQFGLEAFVGGFIQAQQLAGLGVAQGAMCVQ